MSDCSLGSIHLSSQAAIMVSSSSTFAMRNITARELYALSCPFVNAKYLQGENLLEDSYILNSISATQGGAIVSSGTNLTIRNTIFENVGADSDGGAIYSTDKSSLIITQSFFTNCSSNSSGGVIFADRATSFILNDVTIEKALAVLEGTAIFLLGADYLQIQNLTVRSSGSLDTLDLSTIFLRTGNIYPVFLEDIRCFENIGTPSCLFIEDICAANLKHLEITNCTGSGLKIQSSVAGISHEFEDLKFIGNKGGADLIDIGFVTVENQVEISGLTFSDNKNYEDVFSFFQARVILTNVLYQINNSDASDVTDSMVYARLTDLYVTNLRVAQLFLNTNLSSLATIIRLESSTFMLSQIQVGFTLSSELINIFKSDGTIRDSVFREITLNERYLIYSENCNLEILDSSFSAIRFLFNDVSSIIYAQKNVRRDLLTLNLQGVLISEFEGSPLIADWMDSVLILNSVFKICQKKSSTDDPTTSLLNRNLQVYEVSEVRIERSAFVHLTSQSGGAIFIQTLMSSMMLNVSLINSSFSNCEAGIGGAVFIDSHRFLKISGSRFYANKPGS